jgi:hypothetical protein
MKRKNIIIYFVLFTILPIYINAQHDQSKGDPERCDNDYYTTTTIIDFDCDKFEHGNFVLVFEEQFENENTWNFWHDRQPWGTLTGSLGYIQPENVSLENGSLKISIKEEPGQYLNPYYGVSPDDLEYFQYTCGQIESKPQFKYGKFEARVKVPSSHGPNSAFWFFSGDDYEEIDVFEMARANTSIQKSNIIIEDDAGNRLHCRREEDHDVDFSADWHVFSLEWDEFKYVFRVDGAAHRIDYKWESVNGQSGWMPNCESVTPGTYIVSPFIFASPKTIILGSQVPGSNQGFYDEDHALGPYPCHFDVDYVKVYRRSNENRDVDITVTSDLEESAAITGRKITIDGNVTVEPDKHSFLVATERITINPGFEAKSGSYFSVICSSSSKTELKSEDWNTETEENGIRNQKDIYTLKAYPNPAQDLLQIEFEAYELLHFQLNIRDIYGNIVLKEQKYTSKNFLNISTLSNGVYFAEAVIDGRVFQQKFVVL